MAEPAEKIYKSRKNIFIDNFVGGIAWGLGASVGLAILLAVVGYIISRIDWVPFFGKVMSEASRQVVEKNINFLH